METARFESLSEVEPRCIRRVKRRVVLRIGLETMRQRNPPCRRENDPVSFSSQERVKQVVAGKSGEQDLWFRQRVRRMISSDEVAFGFRCSHQVVDSFAIHPPPHVPHGDAVLKEDDCLISPCAIASKTRVGNWIADVGEEEHIGLRPGIVKLLAVDVDEVEAVAFQAIPVSAGTFEGEDMAHPGHVARGVTVEGFGVVACGIVAVHVEPNELPSGFTRLSADDALCLRPLRRCPPLDGSESVDQFSATP